MSITRAITMTAATVMLLFLACVAVGIALAGWLFSGSIFNGYWQ